MDRGAWWATVYGVTMSQTGLSDFHFKDEERLRRGGGEWGSNSKNNRKVVPESFWKEKWRGGDVNTIENLFLRRGDPIRTSHPLLFLTWFATTLKCIHFVVMC